MKKLVFGLIATVMLCLNANAQSKIVGVFNSNETNQLSAKTRIEISGKLHKTNPKKDGTECGCNACFGLCDVKIVITDNKTSITPGENNLTFYVLEDIKHAENTFSIDNTLSSKLNSNDLYFLTGEYSYVKERGIIKFDDGKSYQYYGKVTIKTSMK